jgi:hypothetical protein
MRVSIRIVGGFKPSTTVRAAMRVVYCTGTVIARMAYAHLGHPGPLEDCERCRPVTWTPARDFGVLIHDARGRLVERSDSLWRLLVP